MEISLKDIFNIIKKNLVFIIITALLFSACSFFVTKFCVQKTYTATVKLYVQSMTDNTNSYNDLNSVNYAKALVATYIQMLDTNTFYSQVSKHLNEKYTPSELKNMVKFTSIEDTEVFEADVSTTSPAEAKSVADAIASVAPQTISKLNNNANLKIVDDATLPKEPTSPSVSKNVLIAFLAGLFISLIIAFVRDYFDVKVKYSDDMTTLAGMPILAAIPDFEFFAANSKNAESKSRKYGSDQKQKGV